MTNEEAIKELQSMCDHLHAHGICDKDSNMLTACKMAISALEQPCEDAVSREAVINTLDNIDKALDEDKTVENYKALLKECYEVLPSVTPKSETVTEFADRCRECGARYGKLLKQKSGKWIPVSERLPEEYGEYLITWKNPKYPKTYIGICECEITDTYDCEHHRFEVEWLFDGYITTAYPDSYVIAWMPLPKPYEPQESEEEE